MRKSQNLGQDPDGPLFNQASQDSTALLYFTCPCHRLSACMDNGYCRSVFCTGLQVAKKIETSTIKGSGRQQVKGEEPLPSNNPSPFWDAGQAQPLHWGRGKTGASEGNISIYTQCQCSGPEPPGRAVSRAGSRSQAEVSLQPRMYC